MMKNKKVFGVLLAGILAGTSILPSSIVAYADSQKVVTLGADLSEQQKTAILQYFGILGQNVQTLTITNQDERNHLASYVPLEQIGSHTYSCALVSPTTSGGIQVKTANLSWVTSNMIATTLSTSGVVNCNVLAASPFEVSGTGALTGIIMAYEAASGQTLSEEKKDLANQELVTTGNIANTVGQTQATQIVNDIKLQVIQGQVVDPDQVDQIVDQVVDKVEADAEQKQSEQPSSEQPASESEQKVTVELSEQDRQMLKDLAQQIADQQYNYNDVKDTLQRVEDNVTNVNVNINNTNNNDSSADNTQTQNNTQTASADSDQTQNADQSAAQTQDGTQSAEQSQDAEQSDSEAPIDADFFNTDPNALNQVSDVPVQEDATSQQALADTEAASEEPETQAAESETAAGGIVITTTDTYGTDETQPDEQSAPQEETPAAEETQVPEDAAVPEDTAVSDGTQSPDASAAQTEAAPVLSLGEVRSSIDNSMDSHNITGTSLLRIDIANDNLKLISGNMNIVNTVTGETKSINLTNPDSYTANPLSDEKKAEYGWTEGTEFIIPAGNVFDAPNCTYTVSFDENTFAVQAAEGQDPATAPAAQVVYSVNVNTGAYGLSIPVDSIVQLTAGSAPIAGSVIYDTAAAAENNLTASIMVEDPSILSLDVTDFTLAGDPAAFNVTPLAAGETDVTVTFTDAAGTEISSYTTTITVF